MIGYFDVELSLNLLIEIHFTVTAIENKKLWRKKVLFRVTRLRKVNLLVGWIMDMVDKMDEKGKRKKAKSYVNKVKGTLKYLTVRQFRAF